MRFLCHPLEAFSGVGELVPAHEGQYHDGISSVIIKGWSAFCSAHWILSRAKAKALAAFLSSGVIGTIDRDREVVTFRICRSP